MSWLARYAHWLHLRWPAGRVEPRPVVSADGATGVPGLFLAGEVTGLPLLKTSLDSGARSVRAIAAALPAERDRSRPDLVVVGAGPAGVNAALEARALGLSCVLLESAEPFATIAAFPVGKPIFTYPTALEPAGSLRVSADRKESLLDELRAQLDAAGVQVRRATVEGVTREGPGLCVTLTGEAPLHAHRVLLAVGRSGPHRRLGVPGESLGHVSDRLHDPAVFSGRDVLVVGGGDSAVEAALALHEAGARVTLVHRGEAFVRPRPENLARLQAAQGLVPRLGTRVTAIEPQRVRLLASTGEAESAADAVFTLLGREAPVAFLRRCGVRFTGDRGVAHWAGFATFLAFCTALYNWKSGGALSDLAYRAHAFPTDLAQRLAALGGAVADQAADPGTLLGTLAVSASAPSFWYTLAYSLVVVLFGARRMQRTPTDYVRVQTLTLMAIQVVPLFLLPELLLPLAGRHGWLPTGVLDALFPVVGYGHGREYWRAYGFLLAWPLNVYNVFTREPLGWWLAIAVVQTFVLLPLGVRRFGKGFYCGWICSCGALAETLGDRHREKMPHGPGWNRANLAGQVLLALAFVLLAVRIVGWLVPGDDVFARLFEQWLEPRWKWWVDVGLAGVLGYGAYFWFSGRVWCRFLCPLAALMHVYARGSRFAIHAEKAKCISCSRCTSVCHMGIDVMAFAQRGLPMQDPQCVRCSACVAECPTGVLAFGTTGRDGFVSLDSLTASPVRTRET